MGMVGGMLLTLITWTSCTVVKEDRTDCPCALYVELYKLPSWPVNLSFTGSGFRFSLRLLPGCLLLPFALLLFTLLPFSAFFFGFLLLGFLPCCLLSFLAALSAAFFS